MIQNRYNANMYLKPTDLNDIENDIETLTNDVQQYIFANQQSSPRTIQVGDNLSGKTLYLSFPRSSYEYINDTTRTDIITIDNNTRISYIHQNDKRYIYISYKNITYYIYAKNDNDDNPFLNYVRIKLPLMFGTVSDIDGSDALYQYIKIYENEYIIPNYVKHTYNQNDVLTMKEIDNIENGIKNIVYYYYKPNGYIGNREWLGTANFDTDNIYGVGTQNISYQDLNRWVSNLSLIDFDDLDNMTIWNSNISEIDWNEQNNTEWEEL